MKAVVISLSLKSLKNLYIPHGSDESNLTECPCNSSYTFISHMVQMKDGYVYFQVKTLWALYPTWFRWKKIENNRKIIEKNLYIPHGSDESFVSERDL